MRVMLCLAGLLTTALLLGACATSPSPRGAADPVSLVGPIWRVLELNGNKIQEAQGLRIEFIDAGKIGGHTGVNSLFGSYVCAKPGHITFSQLGMTRMAGPPPAMQIESEFTKALERVNEYRVDGAILNLRVRDRVIVRLRR